LTLNLALENSLQNSANINTAKQFVSADFGLSNPSLLDDNFNFFFKTKTVQKSNFLNIFQKETAALQRASPDFGE
jgi:hypothetical protein